MAKVVKNKSAAPTSSKKMSVLSLLYGALFLGVGGLAGWIYWLDKNTTHEEMPSAQAEIAQPVAAPEQPAAEQPVAAPETKPHEDLPAPSHEVETTQDPHHEDEKPTEAAHEEGHNTDLKHAEEPEHVAEPEHKSSAEIKAALKAHVQDEIQKDEENKAETEKHADQNEEPVIEHEQKSAEHKTEAKKPDTSVTEEVQKKPDAQPEKTPIRIIAEPVETGPLPPVPDPELAKNSDFGLLPIIGPTGRMPWRTYARPFDDPLDRPRIAIIISEMGMSSSATQTAIQNLPGSVTLSFNPYARDLQSWAEQSRAAGHEVLLQLPMEPFGYPRNDPGPHSLLTSLTDRENLNRLEWMLGRFTGYSGVTNQMGSRFTASAEDIRPILDVVKNRGLLFMDGRTSSKSVAGKVAANLSIPVAVNNRFLDHKADRATIDARLGELERIARYTGTAIGIGYPYPVTLERLAVWTQTLARKGFVLAPVSAVINRQEIQ